MFHIKVSLLILPLISTLTVSGCGTVFKKEDCKVAPEQLGKCFANSGYDTSWLRAYKKYCNKDFNIGPDIVKIKKYRKKQLKELCKGRKFVFLTAFKASVDPHHIYICEKKYLDNENVEQINQDAKKVGEYLISYEAKSLDLHKYSEKRNSSWGDELWDRINGTTRNIKEELKEIDSSVNKILKSYSKDMIYRGDLNSMFSLFPGDNFRRLTVLRNRQMCLPSKRL